ncbi:mechanosensitive ion channel domain-containing protein [Thermodesulfobacteriota bacterium]
MFNVQNPILFNTLLNIFGLVLLIIMKFLSHKRHFKKNFLLLINIFTFYFIVRLLRDAALPLNHDGLNKALYLTETLVLALGAIKAIIFTAVELFLHSVKGIEIPKIIQDTVFAILYFILLMLIIKDILDINLTSILTTSAVLTMVLGLSIQDNLSNLFSGLAIQLEKPFSIGEWVEFEGTMGKVKELSWRSVKMLTFENDLLIVPNNKIIKGNVTNFNRPTHLHISRFNVGLSYKHPPNKVKNTILSVLKNEKDIAHEPKPIIRLVNYGDFSIDYEIRYYITNFNRKLLIEDSISTKLWYAFNRDGLRIPFPIRDVNLRTISDEQERRDHEREIKERVALLKSVDVLSPLKDAELNALANNSHPLFFSANEDIINEGDSGDSLYVILKGEVSVSLLAAGDMKELSTLAEGNFFGERSLMTGEAANATISANKDCILFVIDKDNFKEVITNNRDALSQISEILSRRELELSLKKSEISKSISASHIQENSRQILKNIMKFLGF